MNPDKFGYYQVGEFQTYSKIEAIELGRALGNPSVWHFNEEVFSKIDWTVEPTTDLWTMYKARARQIRDNYDYVVLFYSGGSDSHNMLTAWLDANCKVDEVASFWNYDGSKDRQSFLNAEVNNVVFPYIESLKKQTTDFKFRLIEISQFELDVVNEFDADYAYLANRNFSPNNTAKTIIRKKIKDYRDIIASGKKLCFVWGIEKPVVMHDGARYYASFNDSLDSCVNPYVQSNYEQGWYDELFYWTPDMPLLPIKAAHVLRNFMAVNYDLTNYQDEKMPHAFNGVLQKYLTYDAVKKAIYPYWDIATFCNGKAHSAIFSVRDQWFLDSNLPDSSKYRGIIYNVIKAASSEWYDNQNIKIHAGARYYLE